MSRSPAKPVKSKAKIDVQKTCFAAKCKSSVATNSVQCCACLKWQCYKCAGPDGMNDEVCEKFFNDRRISFNCEKCAKDSSPGMAQVADLLNNLTQSFQEQKQCLEELTVKVEKGERDRASLPPATSAWSVVTGKNSRSKAAEIQSTVSIGVAEAKDRESRKNNIVVYGVPDKGGKSDSKSELKMIREAVDSLDQADAVKVNSNALLGCYRIGRAQKMGRDGKLMDRPLKVSVKGGDMDNVKNLMFYNSPQIISYCGGVKGFCREDLTNIQLNDLSIIRDQVKKLNVNCKSQSDNKFKIRLSHGVHSIFEVVDNDNGKKHLRPFSHSDGNDGSIAAGDTDRDE
jgi:hypothetical protein